MGSSPNSSQIYFSKEYINEVKKQREEQSKLLLLKKKTPDKPNFKDEENIWEALFPGFKRLNKDEKNKFKNAIAKMNKDSWKFWMEPLAALGGKSRVQSYTFPMDCSQYEQVSMNFGDYRPQDDTPPKRSHAGIDIYGQGGKTNGKAGHQILAPKGGIVVFEGEYYRKTRRLTIVTYDGAVIDCTEIAVEPGLKAGSRIKAGQLIGKTKKMRSTSMLHIEIYPSLAESQEALREASSKPPKATNIIGDNKENGIDKMDYVNSNQYSINKKKLPFERPKSLHDPSLFAVLACAKQEVSDK